MQARRQRRLANVQLARRFRKSGELVAHSWCRTPLIGLGWVCPDPRGGRVEMDEMVAFGPEKYWVFNPGGELPATLSTGTSDGRKKYLDSVAAAVRAW
jgi:hypothetical protein